MKNIWALLAFSSFVFAADRPPLNDQRIMNLTQDGVSEAEILRLIATAHEFAFDLRPAATDAMLKVGVSDAVVRAMAARESGMPSPTGTPNGTQVRIVPVATESTAKPVSPSIAPIRHSTISSLAQVRRIYVEKLPNDFDQYLRAEFFKQMSKRVTVVVDKAEADAIMTGVDEHDRRIASTITGRYLGLHDNTTASISVLDPSEKVVLWSNEAGDRSLMFPIMHRNGERKVASRIVTKLKKAMKD
jgi:hypothetical protein